MEIVYNVWYSEGMADQDQILPDQFELNLQKEVREERDKVTAAENFYNKERSKLNNQMIQELFGTDKSYTAELNGLNQEVIILDEAINSMGLQDPEAQQKVLFAGQLPARSNYSLPEKYDPDQAVMAWVDSLTKKTGTQQSLEDFIFGKKERIKIAKTRTNKVFFDNYDLTQMKTIYVNELDSRRVLIQKAEDALFHLYLASGKETFFPSQPNKLQLEELENRLDLYHDRLLYHREFLNGVGRGKWGSEEIEEKARELAQEDLKREEEERTAPTRETARVVTQTNEASPPSRSANPPRERPEFGVQTNWRVNAINFFKNPLGSVINFFRGTKTAGTVAKTAQTAAATARIGATVAGGAAVEGGAVAAGTAAGGVPGLVIAAVLLAKKIVNNEQVQNVLSKLKIAAAAAILWLFLNPGAAIGGVIGAMFGGTIGSVLLPFLGPLAPMAGSALGFSAGAFVGYTLQGVVSSILGIGGGGVPTVSASAVAPVASISIGGFTIPAGLSSAVTSFGAMFGGSGISSIVLFGVGGGIGALILSVTITLAAVLQTPEDQKPLGQSIESVFTLKKEGVVSNSTTISYKLMVQAGTNPITVESITDKMTRSNSSSWSKNITVPVSQSNYDVDVSAPEFKDTYVYNLVTVTAKDNVTGKEETKTASSKVKVGSPPIENIQPYGYPAGGAITTLDADIFADGHVHSSCFMNFSPCKWVNGGIDIAPRGGDPTVYSTIDGEVIKAQFIRSSSPIGDVGGVIYIQKGPYIVEYMHLDESVNGLSGHISRGQPIGKVYLGILGATSGPHVHYQVLFNNANLYFNDPNIVGKCSDDKILPVQPVQYGGVNATTSSTCD